MIKDIIKLLRPFQWYKNLVVFLPIIFGQRLNDVHALWLTILGYVALCFISSANYVINDIVDYKHDRVHPEKKSRPIAAGRIKIWQAIIVSICLVISSLLISLKISVIFTIFVALLFFLGQLYSLWLKKEIFADILLISVNFVIRAVSGAYIITFNTVPYIRISPWLILCPFFLALFLATGKRAADLRMLGSEATKHKKVLAAYTPPVIKTLVEVSTTLLIISFSLYVFFSEFQGLFISLPFAIYAILRYSLHIEEGDIIARKPYLFFKDIKLLVSIISMLGIIGFIVL